VFERLAIRQSSSTSLGKPLDLGVLAEALIFYGEVRVIANRALLTSLLHAATPEVVLELLEGGFLILAYEADNVAIQTDNTGTPHETHEPIYFSMPHAELPELLPQILRELYGKSGKARRVSARLMRHIEVLRHSPTLTEEARNELSDQGYVSASVESLLRTYVPGYEGPRGFNVHRSGDKLVVSSDISFPEANRIYHQRIPPTHSSLSPAYLLAHLLSVKADLHFSARFTSEIAIDDVNALIMRQHQFVDDYLRTFVRHAESRANKRTEPRGRRLGGHAAHRRWATTHVETPGQSCSVRDHNLTGEHNEA
jgi:hypothetical protein